MVLFVNGKQEKKNVVCYVGGNGWDMLDDTI